MVVVKVLRGHHPRYILKVGIFSDLVTPRVLPQYLELTLLKIRKAVRGDGFEWTEG